MLKRIKLMLTGLALASSLFLPFLIPSTAHAVSVSSICGGANGSLASIDNTATCNGGTKAGATVDGTISLVLNLFSAIVGIIAVIMIIIGGVKYVTSGGSSEKTTSAKDTILFAIVGLIIVALAQIIVRFVLHKATNLK